VKLDEDKQIVMHDLLRDMGRQVVKNQSCTMENGTPSHLWDPKMVQQVLQNKEVGTYFLNFKLYNNFFNKFLGLGGGITIKDFELQVSHIVT
jgi:hypothetical protein